MPVSTSPVAPISLYALGISAPSSAALANVPWLAFVSVMPVMESKPSPGRGTEGMMFIFPASFGMLVPVAAMSERSPP